MKERKWQPIWYKSCTNFYCHLIQKKHKTIWQAFDKLYTSKRSRQPRDSAAHFTEFCSLIILHKIKRPDAAYFKVRPSVPYFSCWIGCAHVVHFWSFDNGAGKLRESPVHWTSTWTWVRSELSEKQTLIVHCGEFGEGSFKKRRKKTTTKKIPEMKWKVWACLVSAMYACVQVSNSGLLEQLLTEECSVTAYRPRPGSCSSDQYGEREPLRPRDKLEKNRRANGRRWAGGDDWADVRLFWSLFLIIFCLDPQCPTRWLKGVAPPTVPGLLSVRGHREPTLLYRPWMEEDRNRRRHVVEADLIVEKEKKKIKEEKKFTRFQLQHSAYVLSD